MILTIALLGGCTNYAQVEQARLGMSIRELRQIDTPCYYSGESDGQVTYNCRFSVPAGPYSNKRTVKPYILRFENDELTEIKLNEKELDRDAIRDEYHFHHQYYHPYGYYHYGFPYWYPMQPYPY